MAPPSEISTRRLLHWGDLDERRRRRTLRVAPLRWVVRAAVAGGLAAWVWREARLDPVVASRIVLAAVVAAYSWVMLATPFRMYWRVDSPLLARLPVPGRVLFDVALIRSIRAAGGAAVVVAPAAVALGTVATELAVRHLAVVSAVAAAAALLLPAVALGAGALVAGGKASALMRAVGGVDVPAPPTAWLGVLPGLAAAAVVLAVIAAARWAVGAAETEIGPAAPVLGGLAGGSVVAALVARRAARAVMPQAVREVAALDVQRLAHLEIHPPTALERAIGGRLGDRARLIHGKDARLIRRRFPMALVAGATATAAWWIVGAARPASAWLWAGTIGAAFAGYGLLMAWRLVSRPIELGFVATLPIGRADLIGAKLAYLTTWVMVYPLLAAPVLAWRIGPGVAAAVVAGAIATAAAGAGIVRRFAAHAASSRAGGA
jgi:hypothetical protein